MPVPNLKNRTTKIPPSSVKEILSELGTMKSFKNLRELVRDFVFNHGSINSYKAHCGVKFSVPSVILSQSA